MIIAITLFAVAVTVAVLSITMSSTTESDLWLLFLLLSLFCIIGGIATIDSTPMNKDVREGKAHYVEQNHIEVLNGDTINTYRTYQIVWNQNTK